MPMAVLPDEHWSHSEGSLGKLVGWNGPVVVAAAFICPVAPLSHGCAAFMIPSVYCSGPFLARSMFCHHQSNISLNQIQFNYPLQLFYFPKICSINQAMSSWPIGSIDAVSHWRHRNASVMSCAEYCTSTRLVGQTEAPSWTASLVQFANHLLHKIL